MCREREEQEIFLEREREGGKYLCREREEQEIVLERERGREKFV